MCGYVCLGIYLLSLYICPLPNLSRSGDAIGCVLYKLHKCFLMCFTEFLLLFFTERLHKGNNKCNSTQHTEVKSLLQTLKIQCTRILTNTDILSVLITKVRLVVWYGTVRYGTVRCGAVWCCVVWCGMVWYGVV